MASKTLCATCGVSNPTMTASCVLSARHCEFKRRNGNGTNEQIFGANEQNLKTTRSDYQPGNFAQTTDEELQ
jgi:hypothetical protein